MDYSLGIDLGTTYSAAATARGDRLEIFQLGERAATIPSVIVLRADGEVLVGEAAERRAMSEPLRTAREFKRRLGDPTPIILGGTPYGAEALIGHLLRSIVAKVSEQIGGPPAAIAVCHPASYGEYKIDLLRQAVRQADIATSSSSPSRRPPRSTTPSRSGSRPAKSSPSTTSEAARSTRRSCARPRTGSSSSDGRRAWSGSAGSTSTRRSSPTSCPPSGRPESRSTRTIRPRSPASPGCARNAGEPRRACRPTPTRRSRSICRASRPTSG